MAESHDLLLETRGLTTRLETDTGIHPSGERRQLVGLRRGNPGGGRRIGLGKVDARVLSHASSSTLGPLRAGLDPLERAEPSRAFERADSPGAGKGDRAHLPGVGRRPQSGPHHWRTARRAPPGPPRSFAARCPRPRRRAPRRSAHSRPRGTRERLSPSAQRRHEAARPHRDGHRLRSRARDRRRADHGARRDAPGANPRATRPLESRTPALAPPHHPRSRARPRECGSRGGDVRGRSRRARVLPLDSERSPAPLYPRPVAIRPRPARRGGRQSEARGDGGHGAAPRGASAGVRVLTALSGPFRALRAGSADSPGRRRDRAIGSTRAPATTKRRCSRRWWRNDRAAASRRSPRPDQALSHPARPPSAACGRRSCSRRRQLRHPSRGNARARRRVRLGEEHPRAAHPAAHGADVGKRAPRRYGPPRSRPRAAPEDSPPDADHLSGPLQLSQSDDDRAHHRSGASHHPSHWKSARADRPRRWSCFVWWA